MLPLQGRSLVRNNPTHPKEGLQRVPAGLTQHSHPPEPALEPPVTPALKHKVGRWIKAIIQHHLSSQAQEHNLRHPSSHRVTPQPWNILHAGFKPPIPPATLCCKWKPSSTSPYGESPSHAAAQATSPAPMPKSGCSTCQAQK